MAKTLYPAGSASIPSPKDSPVSGEVIDHPAYGPVVVQGLHHAHTLDGDPIEVTHGKGPTIEVPAATATLFAEGAEVQYDTANTLAVTAGDHTLGTAAREKTAGQTSVVVVLS